MNMMIHSSTNAPEFDPLLRRFVSGNENKGKSATPSESMEEIAIEILHLREKIQAHSALQQRYLARVSSLRRTPVALWSTLPFKLSTRGALSTESVSRLEYEVVKCIDGLLNGRLVDLSRDLPQLVNSLAKFAADPPSAEMLKSVTPFIAVIDVRRLPDHKTSLVGAFTEILLTLQALSSTHNSARSCTARLMSLERSLRSDLRSIGLTSENILSTEAPTSPSMEERHTLVRDQSVRDLTQGRRLLGKSSSTSMPRGGSKTAGHAFGRSISDKSIIIGTKPPSLATEARASIRKEVKASKSPPTDHRATKTPLGLVTTFSVETPLARNRSIIAPGNIIETTKSERVLSPSSTSRPIQTIVHSGPPQYALPVFWNPGIPVNSPPFYPPLRTTIEPKGRFLTQARSTYALALPERLLM